MPKDFFTKLNALKNFFSIVKDPGKLDLAFYSKTASLKTASLDSLKTLSYHMAKTPYGKKAIETRLRVTDISIPDLARLPAGTLGREYADFMTRNGLKPYPKDFFCDSTDAQYAISHIYETHDIYHVISGFGMDYDGEMGLQAFYIAQCPGRASPMFISAFLLNLSSQNFWEGRDRLGAISEGFIRGARALPLFGINWAEYWERPIDEVRREFHVEMEPLLKEPRWIPFEKERVGV
jgi:ubiquinone biosynthesis protein COQ4